MAFLSSMDDHRPEVDFETDIGSKLDTISLAPSITTTEYTQSYQNKILPISLRNPMSLTQYQDAMDKHLKAEERPIRERDWDDLTDENKLDLEVEKRIIDNEIQRRNDIMELENFRKKVVEPKSAPSTEMTKIMDQERNLRQQAEKDAKKAGNYECGEVSILPHTASKRESILDKYLHLEQNNKSFI